MEIKADNDTHQLEKTIVSQQQQIKALNAQLRQSQNQSRYFQQVINCNTSDTFY